MNDFVKNALALLNANRISDAIRYIRRQLASERNARDLDALNEVESTYGFMLQYLAGGGNDPERPRLYSNLKERLYSIVRSIETASRIAESPLLYYAQSRTLQFSRLTFADALGRYISSDTALQMAGFSSPDAEKLMAEKNRAMKDVFNLVWTLPIGDAKNLADIRGFAADDDMPYEMRAIIISALMMNLLFVYDREKLLLLAEIYSRSQLPGVQARALTAMLLVIEKYPNRVSNDYDLGLRLETIADSAEFYPRLKEVIYSLVKARGGIKLLTKFERDILPDIMKSGPEILKKFKESDTPISIEDIDGNPAWENLIDKRMEKNLRKLGDLQENGADVMLSMFSQLVGKFHLFNDIDVWFRPISQWEMVRLGMSEDFARKWGELPMQMPMCDLDKYAFVVNFSRLPAQARDMIVSSIESQNSELAEQMSEELKSRMLFDGDLAFKGEAENFSRVLFRFFNYFRLKEEFANPFDHPIDFFSLPYFGNLAKSDDNLPTEISDYYFNQEFYEDAINAFEQLKRRDPVNEKMYSQKIGFCYEKLGDTRRALDYYLAARDSIWGDASENSAKPDLWLNKRLFRLASELEEWGDAHKALHLLIQNDADNIPNLLALASMLLRHPELALKEDKSAKEILDKIDYLSPGNVEADLLRGEMLVRSGMAEAALTRLQDSLDSISMYLAEASLRTAVSDLETEKSSDSAGASGDDSTAETSAALAEENGYANTLMLASAAALMCGDYARSISYISSIMALPELKLKGLALRKKLQAAWEMLELDPSLRIQLPLLLDAAALKR